MKKTFFIFLWLLPALAVAMDCSERSIRETSTNLWSHSIKAHQTGLAETKEDGHISPAESRANHHTYTLQGNSSRLAQNPSAQTLNQVELDYGATGAAVASAGLKGAVLHHLEAIRKLLWHLQQCF